MRITHALLFLSLTALFSCSSDEDATTATELEPTTVNVTFTGLDISITPDLKANAPLRASATESKVTRIAFKVLDATGKEVYSEDKNVGSDNDFDHVVCPLHVGKYTFVAVAHKAKNLDSPVATVTSTDKALLTESYVPKLVYAKTMDVTVAGNTTQNVTMDYDKRITSSFRLKSRMPIPMKSRRCVSPPMPPSPRRRVPLHSVPPRVLLRQPSATRTPFPVQKTTSPVSRERK